MNITIVGPHPDDQELAMGGAIALFVRQGHTVTLIDMTDGEPTPHGDAPTRAKEAAAAADILGVTRIQLGLKNREIEHNIPSRHRLATRYRQLRPDILFIPYPEDAHPDHLATTRIALDARFDAKLTKSRIPGDPFYPPRIIHYFCSHLRFNFPATFCLDITSTMDTKLKAMECYQSQFYTGRPPAEKEGGRGAVITYIKNIATYFGGTIRRPYAEPFSCPEMLGLSSLENLIL